MDTVLTSSLATAFGTLVGAAVAVWVNRTQAADRLALEREKRTLDKMERIIELIDLVGAQAGSVRARLVAHRRGDITLRADDARQWRATVDELDRLVQLYAAPLGDDLSAVRRHFDEVDLVVANITTNGVTTMTEGAKQAATAAASDSIEQLYDACRRMREQAVALTASFIPQRE